MKGFEKYTRQYFIPEGDYSDWMKKDHIEKAPTWCSVDLRDGNQALIIPMSLEEKLEFFELLVKIGFKEIEVGFPAASDTEYEFCRTLIERDMIPDDVAIQVLTQSREHIIKKTFEAVSGCKNAIVHLYNSTSVAQREQVFKKSKREIIDIAVSGARLFNEYAAATPGNFRFEYSPESFTGTEPEFALEICNAVSEVWKPTPEKKVIYNLPVTVSHSMPHVYASQIEYMCKNLNYRDSVIVSLHPHNDRGCAIADTEMGILAGAERVEGTLFGNGERTGNVDIITLALNMYSQGVDPELDFSDLPAITRIYEKVTRMRVYERQPYSGALVFAAFSGSHQDAIAKGMRWRETHPLDPWTVPYLPIDPTDLGRVYEADVIRINSQSGKGGIGYVLEKQFNMDLPARMRETFGYQIKGISDREHRELSAQEVYDIFTEKYVNVKSVMNVPEAHYIQEPDGITATVTVLYKGVKQKVTAFGNGRLDAVSNAVKMVIDQPYSLEVYTQHALEEGSTSKAASYVGIKSQSGDMYWGVGISRDIIVSSIKALVSAVNQLLENK